MREKRQSQIINNFFTFASIIIITACLAIYTKYIREPQIKEEKKIPKLECEFFSLTKTQTHNKKLLNSSLNALNKGYYKISGSYLPSIYSKSIIKRVVSKNELNSFYKDSIGLENKTDIKRYVNISYEIIENDKKDPKNKPQDEFYSGTIKTSFRANSNEFFTIFTRFKLYDKDEINERIQCSIKVYKHHAKHI